MYLMKAMSSQTLNEIIADTMMASNMVYCLYVSQQRDRLFSSYLSEPIPALWSDAWKRFSANSLLKEEECFGDGIVCYNHIVRLKKSMKMKDIHRAIHRMYGIWGMPSQEAFDFCLPNVLNDGGVSGKSKIVKIYGDTNIYKSVMTIDKSHRGSS